ncbi:MAG: hypothetical protein KJI71_00665 [Patescibacteria group bacterium]|nr:hypothetical protein [Patescibacteria group bacterium]
MIIKGLEKCSICFERIKNPLNAYKPNFNIGLVCERCNQVFSPAQRDIITHAFNVARGIFEVTEDNGIVIKDVLYDVQSKLKLQNEETFSVQLLFQKILLRAQIYRLKLNNFFLTNCQYSKKVLKHPNCVICHKPIIRNMHKGDPKPNKENICDYCKLIFSEGEILTMTLLFKNYGGFFNEMDSRKLSLKRILENLLNNMNKEKTLSRMIELNEIALHQALIFGYRPKKFIEELKKF